MSPRVESSQGEISSSGSTYVSNDEGLPEATNDAPMGMILFTVTGNLYRGYQIRGNYLCSVPTPPSLVPEDARLAAEIAAWDAASDEAWERYPGDAE